jgi:flagellar hook-associated protein 2
MALSSPGIGSGLDIRSIVSQMVALEQKPLAQLQTKASTFQARLSAFGQLKSQIANLQDQITKLATPANWTSLAFRSSNSLAVSGSATASATPTRFSVEVSQLARAQSTASAPIASGSAMGGTLSIDIGTWAGVDHDTDPLTPDQQQFTPRTSGATIDIEVLDGDSLSQIATKINKAGAGVTATVLNDASGQRLLLRSSDTGEAAGFRVQASGLTPGSALEQLSYDPENGSTGMDLSQAALDTLATVNGVAVRSANNRFNGVVEGVNLTVSQVTTSPVDITVANDTAAMRAMVTNFVDSYNALNNALAEMTRYDPTTKSAGTLQGDTTAIRLQSALRSLVSSNGPAGGAFANLSAIGVEFQKDGTLKAGNQLDEALKDPAALQRFFTTEGTGLGARLKTFTQGLLDSNGTLDTRRNALQGDIKRNTREQERLTERIARTEERLLAQYSRLDTQLASLNALSAYVNQQVTNWNNQKK